MSEEMKQNLSNSDNWIRLLFVILFAFIFYIAGIVTAVVVLLQFGCLLITGERNRQLQQFGGQMARYMGDILLYSTFNKEQAPFPFADWNDQEPAAADAEAAAPTPEPAPATPAVKPSSTTKKKTTKKKVAKKTTKKSTSKKTS